jgi:hypothetical protein
MDPAVGFTRVRIYDTIELRQEPLPDIGGERPNISPDGKTVAFTYQGQIWVLAFTDQDIPGEFALSVSALVAVAQGSAPAWQPAVAGP